MDASSLPPHLATTQSSALLVDFQWKKFQALITEYDENSSKSRNLKEAKVLYTASFGLLAPHLKIKSAQDDRQIGTGTVHAVSISPYFELHGHKGTLQAKSRLRTFYEHMSYVFSDTETPAQMTWTSRSGFKTWDFICCDENQTPVAKFTANVWAFKKLAKIELLGPKALDPAAMEEIVVVGMTLYYCMVMRVNNIFNLVGSAFERTSKDAKIGPGHPQPVAGKTVD
ncbi:hypothetical protein N7492_005855 [Penicillium capsulatum]|uniref:Uncharacterized protein n=1 Tax=Penicillium capsulatum TaxID=69766 RepID=A0A9W9LRJ2_9EURO|nr:hypothetical protein N7492_005855 [Penicillium capsulatum]KAJ6135043.1 hypothetical protein N7512_000203 [Penicillium capsulatum]